uniref:Retrovirus-related Pol polyprotein from type-1 retrotransposable element R1 n=1 Tax=Schizaphis graminum TaxID=13262 RepID=A0A2S2PBR3_SCHGA
MLFYGVILHYLVRVLRSYMSKKGVADRRSSQYSGHMWSPTGIGVGPHAVDRYLRQSTRATGSRGGQISGICGRRRNRCRRSQRGANRATGQSHISTIVDRMSGNGLSLAPKKSECVVLTKKRVFRDPELIIQGCLVPVKRSVRYQGVHLDTRLSFGQYVTTVAGAARKAASALGRLMPNVGGPKQCKRRLLMSVVSSRLLYGAQVWADSLKHVQRYKHLMLQAQRCAALRVVRCYWTVSDMAALVLARIPPAFLEAAGRKRITDARKVGLECSRFQVTKEMVGRLQELWDSTSTKAAWTKRLIPNLTRWWTYGPRDISFHMAQVLSGQGCF